jgi:hypothetical protein
MSVASEEHPRNFQELKGKISYEFAEIKKETLLRVL